MRALWCWVGAWAAAAEPVSSSEAPKGASLRVVIFPEAQTDCTVTLRGACDASGTTDASGRATLEELATGPVTVLVTCPGREPVQIESVVLVADRLCEIGVTPAAVGASTPATIWMSRLGPWNTSQGSVLTRIFSNAMPQEGRAWAGDSVGPTLPPNDTCGPVE